MKRQITKKAVMAEIREELKEESEFLKRLDVLFKKASEHREWITPSAEWPWMSPKEEMEAEEDERLWNDWGWMQECDDDEEEEG